MNKQILRRTFVGQVAAIGEGAGSLAFEDSETCISLEHVEQAEVMDNQCSSQAFGVELHNAPDVEFSNNSFDFPPGEPGCEIRVLSLGEKIDLSRVVPGAGVCLAQE